MMSEAEVRAIIDANIRDLRAALGLHDWNIDVGYSTSVGDRVATCTADAKRHHATLLFNPGELDDESDVLRFLLHELLHLYNAEVHLYADAVNELVSERESATLQVLRTNASEHVVQYIERLLEHTFRTTPKRMIAAVRRREAAG